MSDLIWPYVTKFIMEYFNKFVMTSEEHYLMNMEKLLGYSYNSVRMKAPPPKLNNPPIGIVPKNFVDYGRIVESYQY